MWDSMSLWEDTNASTESAWRPVIIPAFGTQTNELSDQSSKERVGIS